MTKGRMEEKDERTRGRKREKGIKGGTTVKKGKGAN